MIKKYRCRNIYASYSITVNGINKRVEFTNGTYGGMQFTPARFDTNNPDIQKAVEEHGDFKKGLIWCEMEIPEEGDSDVIASPIKETTNEETLKVAGESYENVTNTQTAKAILKKFGVNCAINAKTSDVVAEAKKLNLVFPNWETYNYKE